MCLKWLNEIPIIIPNSKIDQNLKEELILFVQQANCRSPEFSAAGFFIVDFTLLKFIFGSLTSYVIISLQFLK